MSHYLGQQANPSNPWQNSISIELSLDEAALEIAKSSTVGIREKLSILFQFTLEKDVIEKGVVALKYENMDVRVFLQTHWDWICDETDNMFVKFILKCLTELSRCVFL